MKWFRVFHTQQRTTTATTTANVYICISCIVRPLSFILLYVYLVFPISSLSLSHSLYLAFFQLSSSLFLYLMHISFCVIYCAAPCMFSHLRADPFRNLHDCVNVQTSRRVHMRCTQTLLLLFFNFNSSNRMGNA